MGNITNGLTQTPILINVGSPEIWTILFGIIGLGIAMLGGHLFFCLKQRKAILTTIESFKGNNFIKKLKEHLASNYLLGAKAIIFFIIFSLITYFISLYQLYTIFFKEMIYPINNLVLPIIFTLSSTLITVFISIILYEKKEKLEKYGQIEEVDDIPDIPTALKEDIKKLKDRFGLLQLKDKVLTDKIIESVAEVIESNEEKKK